MPTMRHHLFTTEPLPVPIGFVRLSRAAICTECESIFTIGPSCPACSGESFMPLERWIGRIYANGT